MDLILFQLITVFSLGVFFFRPKNMFLYLLPFMLIEIFISGFWALKVLINNSLFTETLWFSFWGKPVVIIIDSLSAFFILVINFTVLTGFLYSGNYLKMYFLQKSQIQLGFHYFLFFWLYISLLFVTLVREVTLFLIVWEMMSVATLFLVIFESEKPDTVKIGIKFIIQMHIGFVFIMTAFILAHTKLGSMSSFDDLEKYFLLFKPFPLFLLFFIGFGIKAGFIPLHSWLPHAHPAAPSHVSGIMSGVIIKMGIYGILRVLSYIHTNLLSEGIFILSMSVVSGLLGVMYAIVQHDFKKLLAYHSIENIGIIGIGIGAGIIGVATQNDILAFLGFTGGILHILNHSLFKSLLFFSSGSVYLQTHTRNIEKLGGLIKKMPLTASLFLVGALAICGLPPFNGFISEFLIYSGLFRGMQGSAFLSDTTLLLTVLALTIIGGLAIFCFTKVFSIIFLGTSRSKSTEKAKEMDASALFPLYLIASAIVIVGIFPVAFIKGAARVTAIYVKNSAGLGEISATFSQITMVSVFFVFLVAIMWLIRDFQQKKVKTSVNATWGCGYSGADPSVHQYTATSFAKNYTELVTPLVNVKEEFQPLREQDIFPGKKEFKTHTVDIIEEKLITLPSHKLLSLMEKAAVFQSGKLQHYILYPFAFLVLIFLLTILGIL